MTDGDISAVESLAYVRFSVLLATTPQQCLHLVAYRCPKPLLLSTEPFAGRRAPCVSLVQQGLAVYHRSSGISRNESAQDADEAGEHRLDDAGDHRRDEAGNHCPASWITLRPPLQTLARDESAQDAEEINLEQKGINWSAILALPAPEMDATG